MRYVRYIIILSLFFILSSSLIKNIVDYQSKQRFYQDYKQNYEKEKRNNATLKTELRKKDSRTELEKTIRNQLNLLKPDEVAIMIPTPTPSPTIITPTPIPNWKQWINLFVN